MGKIFLIITLIIVFYRTVSTPCVGVSAYYLLAILGPQYIWWWSFEGLRSSLLVASVSLFSISLYFLKNKYDNSFLFNRGHVPLLILWVSLIVSYYIGVYVPLYRSGGLRPQDLISIYNNIFLFYFFSSLEINTVKKVKVLSVVFSLSAIYLIYWANNQYFSNHWWQFNWGRLMGPFSIDGGFIYKDENAFAMFFVCGLPFVYYLSKVSSRKMVKWFVWLLIPLCWHAVFLTGSRGGLVGLGAVMVCGLIFANKKKFLIPLALIFIIFFQWQAGSIMTERGTQIVEYEGEGSAEMRIAAWTGGYRMFLDYPLAGVGLGCFISALPDYYETSPRVAHNTFVQFIAESGLFAGIAYLLILYIFFSRSRYIRKACSLAKTGSDLETINFINDSNTASFVGLTVCGLFLSLNTYEIFFVLLLINNALFKITFNAVIDKKMESKHGVH